MERDWQKEYEWKDLQLSKAEELLEKYSGLVSKMTNQRLKQEIKCVLLDERAEMPIRAHEWDAGADCKAVERVFLDKYNNPITEFRNLKDAVQVQYDLGLGIEVPQGYMLMVACKSSVYKTGMDMANSFGVIDFGYQGRIKVTFNLNSHSKPYHEGKPVCQIILVPIVIAKFVQGEFTEETERGEGGHGSTGNLFKK